jgi:hypothetical protein
MIYKQKHVYSGFNFLKQWIVFKKKIRPCQYIQNRGKKKCNIQSRFIVNKKNCLPVATIRDLMLLIEGPLIDLCQPV